MCAVCAKLPPVECIPTYKPAVLVTDKMLPAKLPLNAVAVTVTLLGLLIVIAGADV